jgi:hypothetical protein
MRILSCQLIGIKGRGIRQSRIRGRDNALRTVASGMWERCIHGSLHRILEDKVVIEGLSCNKLPSSTIISHLWGGPIKVDIRKSLASQPNHQIVPITNN